MIYHATITTLGYGYTPLSNLRDDHKFQKTDKRAVLGKYLKSKGEDKVVFIYLKSQEEWMNSFIKEFGLEENVFAHMPYFVTNSVHTSNGRNLRLIILQQSK